MVIASRLPWDTPRVLGIIYEALYFDSHNHSPHGCTNFNRQGVFVWGLFYLFSCFLNAKILPSKLSRIWRTCFLWLVDSGFWFSVSFRLRFRIPHFRAARPRPNNKCEWTWTAKRTQSKRKPEANPNGTNRRLRVQKTAMLLEGKNKRRRFTD